MVSGVTHPLRGLFDPYYISRPHRGGGPFEPGDLVEVPIPYAHGGKRVVDVRWVDPNHQQPPLIGLGPESAATFDHPPVAELDLQHDEALLAIKHKKRPAVIFSSGTDDPRPARTPVVLCIPVYTLKAEFGEEFVRGVRHLQYRSLFYLPPEGKWTRESFAMFAYAQSVPARWIRDHHTNLAVHPDVLNTLRDWFRWYMGDTPTKWVTELQADLAALIAEPES
jgi:hypothetical protein